MTERVKPDLEELRKVAEAASPGPWDHMKGRELVRAIRDDLAIPLFQALEPYGDPTLGAPTCRVGKEVVFRANSQGARDSAAIKQANRNADYAATFDPPTVLALLSRIETLEAGRGAGDLAGRVSRNTIAEAVARARDAKWEAAHAADLETGQPLYRAGNALSDVADTPGAIEALVAALSNSPARERSGLAAAYRLPNIPESVQMIREATVAAQQAREGAGEHAWVPDGDAPRYCRICRVVDVGDDPGPCDAPSPPSGGGS